MRTSSSSAIDSLSRTPWRPSGQQRARYGGTGPHTDAPAPTPLMTLQHSSPPTLPFPARQSQRPRSQRPLPPPPQEAAPKPRFDPGFPINAPAAGAVRWSLPAVSLPSVSLPPVSLPALPRSLPSVGVPEIRLPFAPDATVPYLNCSAAQLLAGVLAAGAIPASPPPPRPRPPASLTRPPSTPRAGAQFVVMGFLAGALLRRTAHHTAAKMRRGSLRRSARGFRRARASAPTSSAERYWRDQPRAASRLTKPTPPTAALLVLQRSMKGDRFMIQPPQRQKLIYTLPDSVRRPLSFSSTATQILPRSFTPSRGESANGTLLVLTRHPATNHPPGRACAAARGAPRGTPFPRSRRLTWLASTTALGSTSFRAWTPRAPSPAARRCTS